MPFAPLESSTSLPASTPLARRRAAAARGHPITGVLRGARRLAPLAALAVALAGAPAGAQQDAGDHGSTLGEEPLFSLASPVGPIEYRAGRGMHFGRTGLTLGGFATLNAERDEGEPGEFLVEGVNLLAFFEPVEWFQAFSEVEFGDLVSVRTDSDDVSSHAAVEVERLYGDLLVSDALNFRLGKFLTPIGLWNVVPAEPLTWTTSEPVLVENGFDDVQTGGAVYGSLYPFSRSLHYTLYGQFLPPLDPDESPSAADHSAGGRLEYGSPVGDWSAGTSFLASERKGLWNYAGGLDAAFRTDGLELTGELLVSDGDFGAHRLWAFYLQGVFELLPSFYLVGRYEHFAPFHGEPNVEVGNIGLTWIPWGFLHLKADYRFADRETHDVARGLRASLSVLF